MVWGEVLSDILFGSILSFFIFFVLPIFSLVFGIKKIIKYKKKKNNKNLVWGIVLISVFIIFVVLLIIFIISLTSCDSSLGPECIDLSSKCLNSSINITKTTPIAYGAPGENNTLSVTISRVSGTDELGGVALVFTDLTEVDNFVQYIPGDIPLSDTITREIQIPVNTLPNATKVTVVVYFLDESGNPQLCHTTNSLTFA